MTLRGALIGCGFFSENHLHAWSEIEGIEIVALCDVNPERLHKIGTQFGIDRTYRDAADMCSAETLDFVDIATTAPTHRALVEHTADHVGTIICQKPFAETVRDAEAMVATCAEAGATLIVHENFRWQCAMVEMKQLIEDGRIGTPHFARFAFRHGYDNYANQPYLAQIERFTIMDVGLHLFDLARFFLGDVSQLACSTQHLNPIVRGEDAFTALLKHTSGATSVCDCSFFATYSPEPFPNTAIVIEGDAGTLELDRAYRLTVHTKSGSEVRDLEPDVPDWGVAPWHGVQDSVLRFQTHARDVMLGTDTPRPSGADNLHTLRLAVAAYDAAEQRKTIDMSAWRETVS